MIYSALHGLSILPTASLRPGFYLLSRSPLFGSSYHSMYSPPSSSFLDGTTPTINLLPLGNPFPISPI